MKLTENTNSILKLTDLHYNKILFEANKQTDNENSCKLSRKITEITDDDFNIELAFELITESFFININLEASFNIKCDNEVMKDRLIKNNTVAILFPYIRSEVTLITAQPGIEPIVIPPININKLIEDSEKENS